MRSRRRLRPSRFPRASAVGAGCLVLIGVPACSGSGAGSSSPAPAASTSSSATASDGRSTLPIALAFPSVKAIVTRSGSTFELCLWLAATAAERERGLMGVTELGATDGMAFRYDRSVTEAYWMFHTLLPLSIAFFDGSGSFVSSADMDPCPDTGSGASCPIYHAAGPYELAVEVAKGALASHGIGTGATISLGGTCTPR